MALAIGRESYFWHKVHSLTGIIPVGFYMVQHLTLNSFSYAGPERFNGVIAFFDSIPKFILTGIEVVLWASFIFHGVYGLFIVRRADVNYFEPKYRYRENMMYTFQRWSGVLLFLLLIAHVLTTTVNARINGVQVIEYAAWRERLTEMGGLWLAVYAIGVLAASYHLSYGVWNFCIRWGITISERAQNGIRKFATGMFIVVTCIGWLALVGFLMHPSTNAQTEEPVQVRTDMPSAVQPQAIAFR